MRRRASSCGVETTDAADSRDATRRRDARRVARDSNARDSIASVRHRATRAATRDARRGEGRRDVEASTEANDGGRRVDTR
jgi:hypothetical protein